MHTSKRLSTPMSSAAHLSISEGTLFADASLCPSVVGALQYCTITRPDINFVVNKVCQFMHSPTYVHSKEFCAIFKVLLHMDCPLLDHPLCLCWGFSPDDDRNAGGYCLFLCTNLISWSSSKHKLVSRSSAEPQYRLLKFLGFSLYSLNFMSNCLLSVLLTWLRIMFSMLVLSI